MTKQRLVDFPTFGWRVERPLEDCGRRQSLSIVKAHVLHVLYHGQLVLFLCAC
jgi:hypothetical protein